MRQVGIVIFADLTQAIMRAGILKLLCEHAHSTNARLRLNALWALKNLVCSAENEVKMSCLAELGQGWLVQLICDDAERMVLAAGVPRDPGPVMTDVAPAADAPADEGSLGRDHGPALENFMFAGFTLEEYQAHRTTADTSPSKGSGDAPRSRRDDRAVQEQGLAFIRNLICGTDSVDMIDFLLSNLGQERLFEMLCSKLRPRSVLASDRSRRPPTIATRPVPPPGEIIVAVCFILVHIAASHPRHRQLLVSQTELLKLLLPLFTHPNKNVRVALTWIIINLTWLDDQADQLACKSRASELKRLGFQHKLEALEHDPELDVRERTKTALSQIKQAINN